MHTTNILSTTSDINMMDFVNPQPLNSGLDSTQMIQSVDAQRDLAMITEIQGEHMNYVGVLQRRIQSVKTVMNYWYKGDIMAAINALNMMNDLSVVMDVLNNTFADGQAIERLNHDHISAVLPLAANLSNSKFEAHTKVGLKTALNILAAHG